MFSITLASLSGCAPSNSRLEAERAHVADWNASAHDSKNSKSTLHLVVRGVEPNQGSVRIGLYDSGIEFPAERHHLVSRVVPVGSSDIVTVELADIPHGVYALALIYDRNNNGHLDYNFGIFPAEPVAFSDGAMVGFFGPPNFDAAKFNHDAEQTLQLSFL
jgi:uncharacterized protein (DUF2141 family)